MDDNPYQAPQTRLDDVSETPDQSFEEVERLPHNEHDPSGQLFAAAAERSGLNIDALRFVFDARLYAWDFAVDTLQGRLGKTQLCLAVVRFAEELYGEQALAALRDWGLVSGRDVRLVVAALVENGLIEPDAHELADEYVESTPLSEIARGPLRSKP
jgi:uncharacterized repeat protein (TIGR04138 family)